MINLYDVLEAADGQLFGEPVAQIFTDFCFDARLVHPGELFVALKTDLGDGHNFMAQAAEGGATGILCTHPPTFDTSGLTVVVMRSVEEALMRWTQIVLQKFGTTVIAVTGSVGKSTTKEAVARVLGLRYKVYRSPGSFNGRFGLPLALGRLSKDYQIAVLEFGIDQVGEMAEMVAVTKPMVGIVTGIGHAHTERLGTLENIAREKGELIRALPSDGLAVLNFDDPFALAMASTTHAPIMTIGMELGQPAFGADLLAYNIVQDRYKTGFDLRHGQGRLIGWWVPLLGAHQLYGVMAALAVGLSYQISLEEGLRALTELEPLPGRMRPLDGPNGSLLVDDSFTANPEGTLAALHWLKAMRAEDSSKLIFVMGDMDELGSHSPLAHLQIGQQAAQTVDRLVTKGDLAAETGRVALEHGLARGSVNITFSAEDAARAASTGIGPRDIVLVKGGPHARMERVVRHLLANPADAYQLPRQETIHDRVDRPDRPAWVQVSMEAVAYNVRRLKEIIGPDVALMAVVKANAYGHGAIPVSTTALNNGADYLGVASLNEAVELREAGIDAPVLILGYTPAWAARQVIQYDLAVTLYDLDIARIFDRAASDMNTTVRAHIKVDTGMGGLGLLPDEVTGFFRGLRNLKNLQIEGISTQFSAADEDLDYTREQSAAFERIVDPLLAAGYRFKYIHAANSAAAIHLPETRFNMVRAGIALYGLNPSLLTPLPADFKPALEWKTTVAQVKRLPHGSYIGYGNTYQTQGTQQIAIIPVGYADGLRRSPLRWKHVLVKGEFAPLVGRVSMDQTAIDVTQIEDVRIGDEVVLIGQQGGRQLSAEDVADFLDTISYEVVSTILARVSRAK